MSTEQYVMNDCLEKTCVKKLMYWQISRWKNVFNIHAECSDK